MRRIFTLFVLAAALVGPGAARATARAADGAADGAENLAGAAPRATLAQGQVEGVRREGALAFLGLPFAAPPVGDLRFRAPRPPSPFTGVFKADRYSPACMQGEPRPFGPYESEFLIPGSMSEDCLYLNVWTPEVRSASPLPVIVWIHGGGFSSGSTSVPVYDGARLAARGVVVVSLNYRLGPFGFLDTAELEAEKDGAGNFGLLDQIAALKWVRANISAFGGDPDRVAIAGQSAGALSVMALMEAPAAKGLFSRAIAESGAAMGIALAPPIKARVVGERLQTTLKAASLADLRRLPAQSLTTVEWGISFAPTPDGKVLAEDPQQPLSGFVSRVPLLTGYNADETFMMGPPPMTPEGFKAYVDKRFGAFAPRLLALYPHATADEARRSLIALGRDRAFAGLQFWSERHGPELKAPLYLYRFVGVYQGKDPARFASFHTAEVPFLFDRLDKETTPRPAEDARIVREIQEAWIRFAATGSPSADWTPAGGDRIAVKTLGGDGAMADPVTTRERLEALRAFAASGGRLSLFDM